VPSVEPSAGPSQSVEPSLEPSAGPSQSAVPSLEPSAGPSASLEPSLAPSTQDCFPANGRDLRAAVLAYVNGDVANYERYGSVIGNWCVSQVTNMSYIFYQASNFNQDISGWDVSRVTNMYVMFLGASHFDQDISGWDVSQVTNMAYMFTKATDFNQNLCAWGPALQTTNAETTTVGVTAMFNSANSCASQNNPDLTATPPGPFCHVCTT
jgi:surface protein